MDGSMARPFFVSLSVRCRWGPVLRPLLPVSAMMMPGRTWVPLVTRVWEEVAIADGEVAVTEGDIEA